MDTWLNRRLRRLPAGGVEDEDRRALHWPLAVKSLPIHKQPGASIGVSNHRSLAVTIFILS